MNGPRSQFASSQEEFVHNLSTRLLGAQALFCPDCYDHSKEPADVAWVANRCAVLMYMIKSKKPFEKKARHNLAQLHRWLKKWKAGQPLTGSSGETKYSFGFDDIDHVVGLSIVDGGEVWCQYHSLDVAYSSSFKLSACATVTGTVLRAFVRFGSGIRDLVSLLSDMHKYGSHRIAEGLVLDKIRFKGAFEAAAINHPFQKILPPGEALDAAWRDAVDLITFLRGHADEYGINSSIGADLVSSDVIWLSTAEASLIGLIPNPGEVGPLGMQVRRQSGIYTLACSVFAHSGIMAKEVKRTMIDGPGLSMITHLDISKLAPMRIIAVTRREGPSMLEQELTALRGATIGPVS